MKRQVLTMILFFGVSILHAQDSLQYFKHRLSAVKSDSERLALLERIGYEYRLNKTDSALAYFQQSLNYAIKTGNKKSEVFSLASIASVMNKAEDYAQALRFSFLALEKAADLKDTIQLFWINRELLWTYIELEDYATSLKYAKALKYLSESHALKVAKVEGTNFNSIVFRNLSRLYGLLKREDSAYHYLSKAYNLSVLTNDNQSLCLDESRLGEYFQRKKQFDSARFHYHKSIQYSKLASRADVETHVYMNLTDLFVQKSIPDSALYYGRLALNRYKEVPDSSGMIKAAFMLSDIYTELNNRDSAHHFLKHAVSLTNKLAVQKKIQAAKSMLYNTALNDQIVDYERKRAEITYKADIKFYSLTAGLAVVMIIAFLLFKNYRQKHRDATQLQVAYNELKTTQAQLIHSEKMASLGELTAGIAHEIQNPLNFVNNFSEVNTELIEELNTEISKPESERDEYLVKNLLKDIAANLEKINLHGKRADAIVKGMLQHSRSSTGHREPTDVNALADEYLRLAYHGLRSKDKSFNATLETDFDNNIGSIDVIPQDIGRVILNLITNSFYAVTEKKTQEPIGYEPKVSVSTKKVAGKVFVTVRDNGNGIPRNILDKIFQPFYTTKPAGQGTGLGLSLSYDIVKAHGGELRVETKQGEGSKFIIQLPFV